MTRTVLCYGDSNSHGTPPMASRDAVGRFAPDVRWPGVTRNVLGSDWIIIEEALPGRTTVHSDPIEGAWKDGRAYLLPCLETHRPLDAVAVMLGTNDLKARFAVPPEDIAAGVGKLLELILATPNNGLPAPKLLVVCPPPILLAGWLGGMFVGGVEKSERLPPLYQDVAARYGAGFLDAGKLIASSPIDGIHFDEAAHSVLGHAVAEQLRRLF